MADSRSGVAAIVADFKAAEERDSERNQSYDEVLEFYSGKTYTETKKQGFVSGIAQNIQALFSSPAGDEGGETLKTPINLVKPAIENKVAFLALPPTIRIIEPPDQFAPQQATPGGPGMPGNDPEAMGQIPVPVPGAVPEPGSTEVPMAPPGPPPTPTNELGEPQMPGPTGSDWGSDFADRLENVVNTLLSQSNMPKRCRDVAWSISAMDGAVIGAWPDLRHGRPRIFTRTPQDFYPVAYDADGLELQKAMWLDYMSGSEIIARYGEKMKKYAGRKDIEVIQYIDEEQFCTVIDYTEFAHPPLENKMGIVPIVCVGALGLPGMIFGSTDIKDAIPVSKQINLHVKMIEEMAAALIRPTIAIKDPLNVPEDVGIGRGGTITMGPNGSVELLGPLGLPNAFWQLSTQFQQWFDLIADNPNVLRSDDGGGLSTGAGFNAKLGPIAARQQQRLEIIMSAWRQAIKYMLVMWANFPGMKGVDASGVKMKETFYLHAEPADFMLNGEIWTEVDVFLDAQSFMDRQGTAVEIMQLYQNELISWEDATEGLNMVKNKRRTRSKISKDREWKAEGMATAQAAAQSGMTANTPLAAQEKTNYGLERGFMGETGAMPGPEATGATPPPMMGEAPPEMGAPPEGETENMVDLLREFFNGIDKLRGDVWWGGDPILSPQKLEGDDWRVTVWVTDTNDKGTITRAAENVEVVYGHIDFKVGAPSEGEQAEKVGGGEPTMPEEDMGGEPPIDEQMPGGGTGTIADLMGGMMGEGGGV